MGSTKIRQKGVEEAAGRDVGNLGIKIPRLASTHPQMLLHLFDKHGNRPAGVRCSATLRGFRGLLLSRDVQGLDVQLFSGIRILSLVLAHFTDHVQRRLCDLSHRLDELFAAKPLVSQRVLRSKTVFDRTLHHRHGLRDFIPGAFLTPLGSGEPGMEVFLYCALRAFRATLFPHQC